MLRRIINPFLLLPLTLSMNTFNVLSSDTKNYIDNVLEEKSNITFVDYQEIEKLLLNNQELKSLQNLVDSASFNLSSQIANDASEAPNASHRHSEKIKTSVAAVWRVRGVIGSTFSTFWAITFIDFQ